MIVAFETRVFCPSCEHKIRYITVTTVRVNKRSIRETGNGVKIGAFEARCCPGCGEEIPGDGPLKREPYRLVPDDEVKVAEYRKRKWGLEDDGHAVERVRSETAATR